MIVLKMRVTMLTFFHVSYPYSRYLEPCIEDRWLKPMACKGGRCSWFSNPSHYTTLVLAGQAFVNCCVL